MKTIRLLALATATAAPVAAQSFDPPVAPDINPSPTIVEVNLTASVTTWQYKPGINTSVWAYNNSIPGPTIECNVGDTLIVNFTNNLPDPTTIHWHGVELPADQDGSHIAQEAIPPGGTFVYKFPLLREGLYWYHPHIRPFDQIEKGLYGCLLVRDPVRENNLGFDTIDEHIVVFDDVLLDANDQVVPAFSFSDPVANSMYQLNGREGNLLLVNGKDASTVVLPVANGQPQRWHMLNTANTTFCRLDINDPNTGLNNATLWEIGMDSGFDAAPFKRVFPMTTTAGPGDHPGRALLSQWGEGMFLMPGERYDFIFTPIGTNGQLFTLQQKDWYRGRHVTVQDPNTGVVSIFADPMDGRYPDQPYFRIQTVGPNPGTGEYTPPAVLKTLPPRPTVNAPQLDILLGHGNPDNQGNVTMFAQGKILGPGMVQGTPASKVDSFNAQDVNVGDVRMWEVTNLAAGDHPFHTHGFFFELIEVEFRDMDNPTNNFFFQPQARRLIKDTIRAAPRLGAKGRSMTITRLLTHFDDTGRQGQVAANGATATRRKDGSWISGGWLAHCHILEHAAIGMLTFFEVHDPSDPFTMLGKHLAGTNGNPYLTARGTLAAGTPVNLDVVNALPGSPIALVVSDGYQNVPFLGGTLVPGPGVLVLPGTTDSQGEITWPVNNWNVLPSGTALYWQAGFPDAGAPSGLAMSNAMMFRTP